MVTGYLVQVAVDYIEDRRYDSLADNLRHKDNMYLMGICHLIKKSNAILLRPGGLTIHQIVVSPDLMKNAGRKLLIRVCFCQRPWHYDLFQRLTPKSVPTRADSPIATVPQKVILMTPFFMSEPPVLAARAPSRARKSIDKP